MITASGLRRHCAYPVTLSKLVKPDSRSQAAMAKGTAFHKLMEQFLLGDEGAVAMPEDEELASWVTWARAYASRGYPEVAVGLSTTGLYVPVDEPEPHVYVARDGTPLLTAGRIDFLRKADGIVVVGDWKTGKYKADPVTRNLQLTALALAAAEMMGADGFVRQLVYVRMKEVDEDEQPIMLDSAEAGRCWEMVREAAMLDPLVPVVGAHCRNCWDLKKKRCEIGIAAMKGM